MLCNASHEPENITANQGQRLECAVLPRKKRNILLDSSHPGNVLILLVPTYVFVYKKSPCTGGVLTQGLSTSFPCEARGMRKGVSNSQASRSPAAAADIRQHDSQQMLPLSVKNPLPQERQRVVQP